MLRRNGSWFCGTRARSFYDVRLFERLERQGMARQRVQYTALVAHTKAGQPWDPHLSLQAARARYPRAVLHHGLADCGKRWCFDVNGSR